MAEDDPDNTKPMIDGIIFRFYSGGTEGFKGQSRIIYPMMMACYECTLGLQTKATSCFQILNSDPMCTIANTPRLPEHCIEFASQGISG
jgi:ubiquitin-activating enzyme E1 C